MKKLVLIVFSFIFISIFSIITYSYPETIKFKSGKTLDAKIIEKTDKYIKVNISGIPVTYYLEDIEAIDGNLIFVQKQTPSTSTTKTPKDIFKDISPAVVYILNKTLTGDKYLGSGFIIDKEGVIITNLHIMRGAKDVSVKLKDGKTYPVSGIIYYDANRDLCIFKINAKDLPTVKLGDSNNISIGEKVYCIGNPLGLEYSFSDGLLSGIRDLNNIKYLQFTAPVSPGNSGGPLINPQGEVVGIVTFLIEKGQNLNFALAINEIKPYLNNPIKPFTEFVEKVSQADYYLTEGNKYFFGGDYNQAIEYYQKVLQLNPNLAEAYYNLGLAYGSLGQYQKAIEYFQKSIQLDPNLAEAYYFLGNAYVRLGQYQQAIEYYQKSLQLNPNDASAYNNLGLAYRKIGQYQKAIEYCQKALQLDPNFAKAYYNLGVAYLNLGQYQKAKENLLKAKELFQKQGDYQGSQLVDEALKELP